MKKLGAFVLLIAIAFAATVAPSDAGWKKRGWYMKRQGAQCVMRKVTVVTSSGKTVVQRIRVCR
jgi:hypothetical protein